MGKTYTVLIEQSSTGFAGYVPDLPTILVTGGTTEEVLEGLREAIYIYHEELAEEGMRLPEPRMQAERITFHETRV